MSQPEPPRLVGRRKLNGCLNLCAETRHVHSKSVQYERGTGGVTVDIFRAQDPKDVGVVLRITSTGDVGFIAHAAVIDSGVELHLAGDQAERCLLDALHAAIGEFRVITDLLKG